MTNCPRFQKATYPHYGKRKLGKFTRTQGIGRKNRLGIGPISRSIRK